MGRYFKDSGYKTCYIGKWHLDGHDYFGTGICPEEWDEDHWYDGANYLLDLSDEEIDLWRNGLNSIEDLERNNITSEFTGHIVPLTRQFASYRTLKKSLKTLFAGRFL